jgi:hypothetical protein
MIFRETSPGDILFKGQVDIGGGKVYHLVFVRSKHNDFVVSQSIQISFDVIHWYGENTDWEQDWNERYGAMEKATTKVLQRAIKIIFAGKGNVE